MATALITTALNWRKLRIARLELAKQVAEMEAREKALKALLIESLKKSTNKSCSDGKRLFQLVTKDEPTVEDWGKTYAHIQKTGDFDLLHKRLNGAAVKERWEAKQKVPGVGSIPVDTLSDTAAK